MITHSPQNTRNPQSKVFSASSAVSAVVVFATLCPAAFAAGRPITVPDLLALQRVSDPQLAPDGTRALYSVAVPDVAANRSARNVWMVTLATGEARALTSNGHEGSARWSPDGKRIAFVSDRGGSPQLYVMSADTAGDPRQITTLSGGVDQIVWAPDGRSIAFVSEVYPDCKDDACNVARDKERETSKVKARIYDRLLYRHWTSWSDGKRNHVFVVAADGGSPRDLTPGADYDAPPREREGPHPMAFAPDSRTICFTAVTDPVEAASTNGDLFEIDVTLRGPQGRL